MLKRAFSHQSRCNRWSCWLALEPLFCRCGNEGFANCQRNWLVFAIMLHLFLNHRKWALAEQHQTGQTSERSHSDICLFNSDLIQFSLKFDSEACCKTLMQGKGKRKRRSKSERRRLRLLPGEQEQIRASQLIYWMPNFYSYTVRW